MGNKHHKYSPSTLDRAEICPSSPYLSEGLPDVNFKETEDGKEFHKALETGETKGLNNTKAIGVNNCEMYVDKIKEDWMLKDYEEYDEFKIKIIDDDFSLLTEGTSDKIIVPKTGNMLFIIDWKSGYIKYSVKSNQFKAYAAGACQYFGKEKAMVVLCQPFINHYDTIVYDNITEQLRQVKDIIYNCKYYESKGIIKCVPSDHCKYCKAKFHNKCQAYQMQENKLVKTDKNNLSTMSDLEIVKLLEIGKDISKKTKAIDNEVRKRIESNGSCGGYEINEKQGNRGFKNISQLQKELDTYIGKQDFLKLCEVGFGNLQNKFIDAYVSQHGGTKKAAREEFEGLTEKFTTRGKSKQTLEKVK